MGHVAGDHHLIVADPFQYFRQKFLVACAGQETLLIPKRFRRYVVSHSQARSTNILDLFHYLYDSKVACSWAWFLMGRQNLSEVCMRLREQKLLEAKAIAILRESPFRKIVTGICLVFCLSVAPARLLADGGVVHRVDQPFRQSYSVRRGVILTTSARVSVTAAPSVRW